MLIGNNGVFTDCYYSGEISFVNSQSTSVGFIGGIASAESSSTNNTFTRCYSTGTITVTGNEHLRIGGIAGGYGSCTSCVSMMTISTTADDYTGHMAGYKADTLTSCYYLEGTTVTENKVVQTCDESELTAVSASDAKSTAFWTTTLGFDSSVWTITFGSYPTL